MPTASAAHAPALPAMGVATLLRALFKRPQRPLPSQLAELHSTYRLDRLPLDDIDRYRAAFGFSGGHVPLTWWYLVAQRAHLATMLEPGFPFRIAGLVHVDNTLEAHSAPAHDAPLLLRTMLRLLPPSSTGALRCVLETSGSSGDRAVFTCTSTYLIRRGGKGGPKPAEPEFAGTQVAQWTLDPAAGRRYARLSGDWNPIHLYGWSARLMGMRAPIIHGMHTLAASCAALERVGGRPAMRIACRFRAPVALGRTVSLWTELETGEFMVKVDDRTAVTGQHALA